MRDQRGPNGRRESRTTNNYIRVYETVNPPMSGHYRMDATRYGSTEIVFFDDRTRLGCELASVTAKELARGMREAKLVAWKKPDHNMRGIDRFVVNETRKESKT